MTIEEIEKNIHQKEGDWTEKQIEEGRVLFMKELIKCNENGILEQAEYYSIPSSIFYYECK